MACLGISAIDFWNSTPNEIYYALDAYSNSKIDTIKEGWEQMRLQTFYLLDIQLDRKSKMSYNEFKRKYMPFQWDEKPEVELPENIDWDKVEAMFEKHNNSKTKKVFKF